mmetsp:Transcript_72980/g.118419  ORF Transcript_72980/g.118419 Transcript_72980/m.118419 type:complete len:90 (-) Transcript_72980:66-335(-)
MCAHTHMPMTLQSIPLRLGCACTPWRCLWKSVDMQFAPDLSVTIYDECVAALVLDYSFRQHLYCTIRLLTTCRLTPKIDDVIYLSHHMF